MFDFRKKYHKPIFLNASTHYWFCTDYIEVKYGQRCEFVQQVKMECCCFVGFVSRIRTREFTLYNNRRNFWNLYIVIFLKPFSIFTCWLTLPLRCCTDSVNHVYCMVYLFSGGPTMSKICIFYHTVSTSLVTEMISKK